MRFTARLSSRATHVPKMWAHSLMPTQRQPVNLLLLLFGPIITRLTRIERKLDTLMASFEEAKAAWVDYATELKAQRDEAVAALEQAQTAAQTAADNLAAFQADDAATDAAQLADQAQTFADELSAALDAVKEPPAEPEPLPEPPAEETPAE